MNQGVPVVLASDDPAMFNNMGLSFDFYQVSESLLFMRTPSFKWQVLVASEVTGLITLGQIARDSIAVLHMHSKGVDS